MSEGTGPRSEQRHCADADGDHRFGYDEEPQSRQKHEEAAHDDDCRSSREETFRRWDRGADCSLHRKTGRYVPIVALTLSWVLFVHAKELLDEANPVGRPMLPLAAGPLRRSDWRGPLAVATQRPGAFLLGHQATGPEIKFWGYAPG